ncbi:MAG: HAD-IIIA family hydrolase, partial [Deltaproteobacteria bacterium]|nr:HAD-IIIA family hydrolase [Deltaproteobacteria bacterium]
MAGHGRTERGAHVKRPAVFIDRDGTINEQMGYINHPGRFVLLPGTARAIKMLKDSDRLVIVVSNQSGVARGYFPIQLVHDVHRMMTDLLAREDTGVDGVYFCPHHPGGTVDEYRKSCECRKPATGLIQAAKAQFRIDMSGSYVIGDRLSDMELAERCGLRGILVKTGYGAGEIQYLLPTSSVTPWRIAENLLDAARVIVRE